MPAALNARTHCRASNAVGLNTAGSSRPLPHSTLVKVFGPKCTKAFVSMRCHETCAGEGTGSSGAGASARAWRSEPTRPTPMLSTAAD